MNLAAFDGPGRKTGIDVGFLPSAMHGAMQTKTEGKH
jgi:hypothetical protein